jgi:uncharacterized membrane protein
MFSTSHLHPMLVHFPIALVLIGFLAEVLSFFMKSELALVKVGFYLLLVGTISSAVTWLSGILFTADMSGSAGEIREIHELFAGVTVVLLITALILRVFALRTPQNSILKWTAFLCYFLATISVAITGFYGGSLVYNYMMPL